jgi:hypothetical protein
MREQVASHATAMAANTLNASTAGARQVSQRNCVLLTRVEGSIG